MQENIKQPNVILEGQGHRIEYFKASLPTKKVVFVFSNHGNRRLDDMGFGGSFCLENGFDVVAVKTVTDLWYQDLPSNAFDLVNNFLDRFERSHEWRASYGSSMGAYAAITFAGRLKANAVFAISPVLDLFAPYESRWSLPIQYKKMVTVQADDLSKECMISVAYDPYDNDARHVVRLRTLTDRLHELRINFGGHPVGGFLSQSGLLKPAALAALNGAPHTFPLALLKKGRHSSPHFLFKLSAAASLHRKRKAAWALINRALKMQSLNPIFRLQAAHAANALGLRDEAIVHAATAVAIDPTLPKMRAFLAELLESRSCLSGAEEQIIRALESSPSDESFLKIRDKILARKTT